MRKTFLLRSLSAILALTAVVWAQAPLGRGSSPYAGSDSCQPCHDELFKTMEESAHGALMESRNASQHGCESCHGPGAAHVNGNGDPNRIFRFTQASPDQVRARCVECHATLMGEDAAHAKRSCLDCHSAHHYQQKKFLLIMGKEELCRRCH